jgi:hypothetical protein
MRVSLLYGYYRRSEQLAKCRRAGGQYNSLYVFDFKGNGYFTPMQLTPCQPEWKI